MHFDRVTVFKAPYISVYKKAARGGLGTRLLISPGLEITLPYHESTIPAECMPPVHYKAVLDCKPTHQLIFVLIYKSTCVMSLFLIV